MLNEISQSHRANIVWLHLYEMFKIVKIIDAKSGMVVDKAWEEREMSCSSTNIKFQLCMMNKS